MNLKEEEKLGRIVALAKNGVDGEKEIAVRMVHKLCEKYGLHFDDVMREQEKVEAYEVQCMKSEFRLLMQVVVKFAFGGKKGPLYGNHQKTLVAFETTKLLYIETMNAWSVLSRAYKKEMEKIQEAAFYGFLEKHDLYLKLGQDQAPGPISEEEFKARMLGSALATSMEGAQLFKALPTV